LNLSVHALPTQDSSYSTFCATAFENGGEKDIRVSMAHLADVRDQAHASFAATVIGKDIFALRNLFHAIQRGGKMDLQEAECEGEPRNFARLDLHLAREDM
jgi:hypothetical protein